MPTRHFLRAGLAGLAAVLPALSNAQVQVAAPTRAPTTSRELVAFGFDTRAGTTLPPNVTRVRPHDGEPETRPDGYMQMVVNNGQPMLKASGQVALLVTLPEVLPADFTVEFDLVPKSCCNPEDISIEGTKAIDRGPESALVGWSHDALWIHGGGSTRQYRGEIPKALDGQLVGKLTRIVFEFSGDQLRVFTNGIQHLPDPPPTKFERRHKVLRVLIGGDVNDVGRDVYLARMRVVANAPAVVATQGRGNAPNAGSALPSDTDNTNKVEPGSLEGISVAGLDPWGVRVSWDALPGTDKYEVQYTKDGTRWATAGDVSAKQLHNIGSSNGSFDWTRVQVGQRYQFRVLALDDQSVALGMSDAAVYRAPAVPQVTNLVAVLGTPTGSVGQMVHPISWKWDAMPGITKYVRMTYLIKWDSRTLEDIVTPEHRTPRIGGTGTSGAYGEGIVVRLCSAPMVDPQATPESHLEGAACVDTPLKPKPKPVAPAAKPLSVSPINGFTVSSLSPWGVALTWDWEPNAPAYEVHARQNLGAWTRMATVTAAQFKTNASFRSLDIKPGVDYEFRVQRTDGKGTVLAQSAVEPYPAVAFPMIENLTPVVSRPMPNAGGTSSYTVTWTWDAMPMVASYMTTTEEIMPNGTSQQGMTTGSGVTPNYSAASPMQVTTRGGRTQRFCVAPRLDTKIREPFLVERATCVDVPLGLKSPPPEPPPLPDDSFRERAGTRR